MIPRQLSDWSVDALSAMLEKGIFEDESFDFKEMLPDTRNDKDKDRLRKTCAAFANSEGGFLVLGVSNLKVASARDRIVGIDQTIDFPEHFGNYPKSCYPSVGWEFRNPPLSFSNGRVVHIVQIPKSWRAPHAVAGTEGTWAFPKRTNKGNEPMSIEEVRSAFLGFYEKRLKLQLLRSELLAIDQNAQEVCITDPEKIGTHYSLVSFDTAVVEAVIADTYSITAGSLELHGAISRLRQAIRVANNKIHLFFNVAMQPLTNKEALVRDHNEFMQPLALQIRQHCQTAITALDIVLRS